MYMYIGNFITLYDLCAHKQGSHQVWKIENKYEQGKVGEFFKKFIQIEMYLIFMSHFVFCIII